jgi:hypothetical protein
MTWFDFALLAVGLFACSAFVEVINLRKQNAKLEKRLEDLEKKPEHTWVTEKLRADLDAQNRGITALRDRLTELEYRVDPQKKERDKREREARVAAIKQWQIRTPL